MYYSYQMKRSFYIISDALLTLQMYEEGCRSSPKLITPVKEWVVNGSEFYFNTTQLGYIGSSRNIHLDRSMTFPSYKEENLNKKEDITPRMVINRIKHIIENPIIQENIE